MEKKMELDVLERLALLGILPKEGSFMNMKLLRLVKEDLSFTEDENAALQFRMTEGPAGEPMVGWNLNKVIDKKTGAMVKGPTEVLDALVAKNPKAYKVTKSCPPREFVFGDVVMGLIVKALTELDKAQKITQEHYSLYEKFMEGQEETQGK